MSFPVICAVAVAGVDSMLRRAVRCPGKFPKWFIARLTAFS